jgi:hypothetical protein
MNIFLIIIAIILAVYYLLIYKGNSFFHRLHYRTRFVIAFLGFLLFWFIIFYPIILPYMNDLRIHPLLATVLFEGLFYLTLWTFTAALMGQDQSKKSFKVAFIMFAIYHAMDAVEPPFIVNPDGTVMADSPTALISWDYGFGYTFHQLFNWDWSFIYYFTNIFVILSLLLVVVKVTKPQLLSNIMRRVID